MLALRKKYRLAQFITNIYRSKTQSRKYFGVNAFIEAKLKSKYSIIFELTLTVSEKSSGNFNHH